MEITYADKRVKAVANSKPGDSIKNLQPEEVDRIRTRLSVLGSSDTLWQVREAHVEWRVHEWKGHKGFYSIDVLGNTRLLFSYDKKAHECHDMVYDDPH